MNSILKQPTKVRIAAAVLLVAGAAGAVALMRGSPAQSSESKPAPQAAAKPAAAPPAAGVKPPAVATLGAVQVDRDELQRQLQALPPRARSSRTIARAWINGCAPGSPRRP